MEKANIQNWAYSFTTGGNAKENKCFGKLYKQNDMVTLYLRLLSEENHDNTDYLDYAIQNGIPQGFRPVENFYHTTGNINNNHNVTIKLNTDGSIQARIDNGETKINTYTLITYPIK